MIGMSNPWFHIVIQCDTGTIITDEICICCVIDSKLGVSYRAEKQKKMKMEIDIELAFISLMILKRLKTKLLSR